MSEKRYSNMGPVLPEVPVVPTFELEKNKPFEFKSNDIIPVDVPPTIAGTPQTVTAVLALLACFKFWDDSEPVYA